LKVKIKKNLETYDRKKSKFGYINI
jgi:hypothetical protein